MSILSDAEISERCTRTPERQPMIHPYIDYLVRENSRKVISYGVSSFGYDVRLSEEFKIFSNINSAIVDPKHFDEKCLVDGQLLKDPDGSQYVILPPNSYLLGRTIEYFHIPNDIMVVCVGKSTLARCFSGDTKVALVDGTSPTFIELIERFDKGERLFGYSLDNNMDIQISELVHPRKISNEEIIEVKLDSGEIIKTTPDHKFILLSGEEVEAADLKEGTQLQPLYRVYSRGYEAVNRTLPWGLVSTHWLADEWNLRHGIYNTDDIKGPIHRHHIDHNKRNNVPSNIERKLASEHISEHNRELFSNPDFIENFRRIHKLSFQKSSSNAEWMEKFREKCSKASKIFWTDPKHEETRKEWARKSRLYLESEKGLLERQKKGERLRVLHRNTQFALERNRRLRELWADPDFREAMAKQCSELNVRKDITAEKVREALDMAGSIRGAAKLLRTDKSTFRRFKEIISEYKAKWESEKVTNQQFLEAMYEHGSATKAAKSLGISRSGISRHYSQAVSTFYNGRVADNHKVISVTRTGEITDTYCLTAPEFGNFALEAGVFVKNCGLICNVTPIEAGFEGHVVIEISNATTLPVKVYANEGVSQFLFFEGKQPCSVSYSDRGGKYQGQTGITLAKT